jgi:hypothetical protein
VGTLRAELWDPQQSKSLRLEGSRRLWDCCDDSQLWTGAERLVVPRAWRTGFRVGRSGGGEVLMTTLAHLS